MYRLKNKYFAGLGRASRSIFMKLDANQASNIIKSQVQTKPEKTIMNSANVGPKVSFSKKKN